MNNDELNNEVDINGKYLISTLHSGLSDARSGQAPVTVKQLVDSYFDALRRAQRYHKAAENVRRLVLQNTTDCPFCRSRVFTTMEEAAEAKFGSLTQEQKDQWG